MKSAQKSVKVGKHVVAKVAPAEVKPPAKQVAAAEVKPPVKQVVAAEVKPPAKQAAIALAIHIVDGAVNKARANSKRHAWLAAVMGAKTVQQALATTMPAGVEPVTIGHVNWAIKNKLVRTTPIGK